MSLKLNIRHDRSYDFHGGSDGKVSVHNVGDPGLIPGLGRCPGEENGNPLQYSCLENSMDGGAWWATVHGVAKSQTRLSDFMFTFVIISMIQFQNISIISNRFILLVCC